MFYNKIVFLNKDQKMFQISLAIMVILLNENTFEIYLYFNMQKQLERTYQETRNQSVKNTRTYLRQQIYAKNRSGTLIDSLPVLHQHIFRNQRAQQLVIRVNKQQIQAQLPILKERQYGLEMFDELVHAIKEGDIIHKLYGLIGMKKLLLDDALAPYQEIFQSGLIPFLIEDIKQHEYHQIQIEAISVLTNYSASIVPEHISHLTKHGVIPLLLDLLNYSDKSVAIEPIYCLVNIAIISPADRDIIIQQGGLQLIKDIGQRYSDDKIKNQTFLLLSHFCRTQPLPSYNSIKETIRLLIRHTISCPIQTQKLPSFLWAIALHTEQNKARILLEQNAISVILNILDDNVDISIIRASLRIVGNISKIYRYGVEQMLRNNGFNILLNLLSNDNHLVKQEVCQILSNIACDTEKHVIALINYKILMNKLVDMFQNQQGGKIKQQICFIFGNMWYMGPSQQILKFYKKNSIMKMYIACISFQRTTLQQVAIQRISQILKVGQQLKERGYNPMLRMFEKQKGFQTIKGLNNHENELIREESQKIIDVYFDKQNDLN